VTEAALWRRLTAELLGSAFLAAVVIGSGIAAQALSPGHVGLELFENAAATAAGLYAIILMFGPVSGAHFNPVVSFVDAAFDGLAWRDAWAYLPAQVVGCVGGAVVANVMFVAELQWLVSRDAFVGDVRRPGDHQHSGESQVRENHQCEHRKTRNQICTAVKNLGHVKICARGSLLSTGPSISEEATTPVPDSAYPGRTATG